MTSATVSSVSLLTSIRNSALDSRKEFTPLESHSTYAGDGGNGKYQLVIEGGVKALLFLTGFTKKLSLRNSKNPE
jgi:hypothetical protein